eukprot:TRINITY_DN556_c0_g2_i2.p1 TRINITY_DN556_c0_g2~~TRINITY_DN556_c0_g2_i2.p1  ORF type:complete len:143 (-),score=57.03 TRINITY_DN556_c0_g2_i2:45-473(-)
MSLNTKQYTPEIAVCAQPTAEQIEEAASKGFKSVINLRPEGEAGYVELREQAEKLGLQYNHVPFNGSAPSAEVVQQVISTLAACPKPVLAYCKTGRRVFVCLGIRDLKTAEEFNELARTNGVEFESAPGLLAFTHAQIASKQ